MTKTITSYYLRGLHYLGSFLVLLVLSVSTYAQSDYTFQGTVTGDSGEPVPGATVQIENTNFGTVTDIDGAYVFQANLAQGNYTLVCRSLGQLTKKITLDLASQTTIVNDIGMVTDILNLDEIVITGTSVATSKRQLGNAISTVKSEDIAQSNSVDLTAALTGKVAGALIQQNSGNPAGGISVRLRGVSTLAGSSDPLYIVDGVIVDNSSNGVIDIGGASQNRLVDINPQDIESIEIIKGAAAAAIYGSRANNGVVQIFTKRGQAGKSQLTFGTTLRVHERRKEIEFNDFPFVFGEDPGTGDEVLVPTQRFDYYDDVFRTAVGTDNFLSLKGGNENTRYYVSGSYLLNEGIIKNQDFERYGLRLRIDQVINDWASLSLGSNFSYSNSNDVPNGGIAASYGVLTAISFNNNITDPNKDPVTGEFPSLGGFVNHLDALENFDFSTNTKRYIGDLQLNLNPIEGLDISYVLGIDTYTEQGKAFIPPGTTVGGFGNGFSRRADLNRFQINNDLTVGFQKKISSSITSTTSIGGTLQYEIVESIALNAINLVPFVQVSTGGDLDARGDSRSEIVVQGAYLQQTFGFQDKLFLTGAIRVDGSSVFGEDERTQTYPKLSGSYVLSEENFWQGLNNIAPLVKFRASYGEAGNLTGIGPFDRFTNVNVAGGSGLLPSTQRGNLDVRPERQKELEFGVDLAFLNNKVGVEFTYYDKKVEDLLLNRTLAPTTGFQNQRSNVGTLENNGIELLIRATPFANQDFSWTVTGIFSTNENEISGLEEDFILLPGSFGQSAVLNGESLGVFYTTYTATNPDGTPLLTDAGLPQRDRVGRDADGQPVGALAERVIGDPNPDYTASLINEVNYKNFNFRLQFDAIQGFDVFNFTRRIGALEVFGNSDLFEQELRGELPRGYNGGGAAFSTFDRYIEDGSFVKLREVSVSYNTAVESLGISRLSITLAGRNLFSFDDYTGRDPETNAAGQSTVRGFDFNEVPIPRTYSLGITATF
ncbi:SusC/RagA family TonB-linked outer membrane protein [Fulvivirga sp. M361]|uniref:TonB-dependent receptor plug domain-containing protein n=1 Tax=Fulvivirga sp. M361 TaxID=2594266 RepID=UPI00117AAA77|nr:TonB-dependent receptor plug domain-containing protein [Fulvivirga sp. M361]TRX50932.1 SusC/RagA family TonB-linked outer membrane protein [Fulvivirga sp. M361]